MNVYFYEPSIYRLNSCKESRRHKALKILLFILRSEILTTVIMNSVILQDARASSLVDV